MSIGNKLINSRIRNHIGKNVLKKLKNKFIEPGTNIEDRKYLKYYEEIIYSTDKKAEFIIELENANIYTSYGIPFDKNRNFIDGIITPYFYCDTSELGGRFLFYPFRKKKYIKGRSFSLAYPWNVSYGHWVHNILPRLLLLKDSELFDNIDTIILGSGSINKFHNDSIKLLLGKSIDDMNIEYISDSDELICENLVLTSFPGTDTHCPPKWACDKFSEVAKKLDINKDYPEKIYLSREKVKTRRIINEDELMSTLAPLGYVSLCPEDYTFEEQILLFYNAKKIISLTGSGLTNIVFCNNGNTSILDIMPSIRTENTYEKISNTIGLVYRKYLESNREAFVHKAFKSGHGDFDMKISMDKFILKLDEFEK